MRVNPNPMPDLLEVLGQTRQQSQEALLELASGLRVHQPSDDPAAAALLVANQDQVTLDTRYSKTSSTVQGQMQIADSTLGSIETALQQALSLGVEGANGTLSDADRAAVVAELQGIQSQLLSLANTSYQGQSLFAGTATSTAPFVQDNTQASGVRYVGNNGVNTVQIGTGYRIAVNKPGSQLFISAGHDMFQGITNLIQAMQANSGYDTAITSVRAAFDYVSQERVFYGNGMNQAQSQSNYLETANLQLAQEQNTLGGADMASAATNLASDQASLNATLAAMGRFQQMSLFDYLK
jgi:flagellar hook-associated protein 3 FlgL